MSIFDLIPPAIHAEQIQERPPIASDTITECAAAYEARFAATNDPREAAFAFIDRMRDSLDAPPNIGPERNRERLSRRTKRKLQRALQILTEQGRNAA